MALTLKDLRASRNWRKRIVDEFTALTTRVSNIETVNTSEIADNAVTYSKLDATGRKYKIRVSRSASDTAGTDWELPLGSIDFAGTVKSVKLLADTAFGQATNYSSLDVKNKGQAGSGTTSVASMAFNSTNTVSQWVPKALTLSATPANLNVVVGDALTLVKTHSGDGQALPTNLIVEVVVERTA
jgi:hypothetical protein